jgi:mannose-6-phosphate isomerase-like protein (cupin superfamily)
VGAIFLEPGAGELTSDTETRRVVIKADVPQIAVTETLYGPGERGPEAHVHRQHVDAFFVLEGALVFGIGPGAADEVEARAGSLVLVPAGVVHTFGNESATDARFLNIHAPGMGFGEYLRAMRDGRDDVVARFDSFDPPADGGSPASEVVLRGADEGETIAVGPARATFKAEGSDGAGTFSLSDGRLPPGFQGPPLHRHETFADSFFVLAGTLTVHVDDDTRDAPPGSFALVPPGTAHTFSNAGDEPVRELNLMAPGGFEQYLKEVARAAGDAPPDPQFLASVASKYDFHAVVQPY